MISLAVMIAYGVNQAGIREILAVEPMFDKNLYGRTKPGTLLRHQIPIKCESWDEVAARHMELDTVSHSGENSSGTFITPIR